MPIRISDYVLVDLLAWIRTDGSVPNADLYSQYIRFASDGNLGDESAFIMFAELKDGSWYLKEAGEQYLEWKRKEWRRLLRLVPKRKTPPSLSLNKKETQG